ncbi:DUF484 family protein [Alteromonas mediterranea]|jgi:uncharacterized protein|uniref:DUF484 domain-containing protein n=2 Tax=Alteromonas mediterranea TaxID=314275 RepID=A0AAC9ACB8_9ALTE|nr:DUF484 family protein [Alteromonas mediterranea]AGP91957.1 hypothetical protein I634_01035 [Alteromonas mediterranea U8]MBR9784647.1 DUF484 family protein [Gammaproteobacteria bacterium]MEA3379521.1 DUF484 family protein [Pseudomonadota bacterium]AEA96350.1 hypothetical protein MADE_1001005 [Alteromonas mediterranea DE]AFV83731.1 hypothetical protein amad1_00995 [Alteromonas mediterranea DE1]|tara:strand:- start:2078 stop:2773 length:696 start_codon:yes stop_codon:yes gene_type:complete
MNDLSGQSNATQIIEPFNDTSTLSSTDVHAFLLENPEFFAQYPDLLEKIKLPHEHKGSVSLVEIQSDQLRQKVRQLNFKLNQLVTIAKQNEKIYRVYTDLNVQLLRCESVAEVQFTLEDVLQERLQLSSAVIKSFKGPHAIPELQQRLFTEKRFKNTNFFFGRLSQHERQLLFGESPAESVALMLLGDNRDLGILGISSSDASHFTPDMDTLLLQQLQQVLNIILPEMMGY